MDSDVLRGNIIKGVIALIVTIIAACAGWKILMYIGIVYVISDIIWILGDYNPLINAVFTVIIDIASAITFVITKNDVHFFSIMMWIGYFKSQRLWGEVFVYDQYYSFIDDKIYDFVNEDSSLITRFIATIIVCIFYVLLASPAMQFTPLAFLPALFLIYRVIRIYYMCRDY